MQLNILEKKQNELTSMIDNLYMDKLRGIINEAHYNKYYRNLAKDRNSINLEINTYLKVVYARMQHLNSVRKKGLLYLVHLVAVG